MATLSNKYKITKLTKNIGNKYELILFQVGYKKRITGILNYRVQISMLLDLVELKEFLYFYNHTINCINPFNADFEILRQNEIVSNFVYKFEAEPNVAQGQGDLFTVDLNLIRVIEGCPANFLLLLTALNNIKRNNQGENRSDSTFVSCPIAFQGLGVAITNIANAIEETPYDYSLSYTFT